MPKKERRYFVRGHVPDHARKSVIRKEENDNAGSPGKAVRTAIKHDNLIARCIRRPSVSGGATW
uniref:hypothetical protein n=1 Tax=Bifidobacterium adolescentis TaxID=1680 RepID=UPI003FEE48CA